MFCTQCGNQLAAESRFCSNCGHTVVEKNETQSASAEQPSASFALEKPSFDGTRKINWVAAAFLTVGFLLIALSNKSPGGFLMLLSFTLFFIGTPVLSAIAIGESDFAMFGIYIAIDPVKRKKIRKIALVLNWITFVFGCVGLLACIGTQQYGPMIPMLVYIILPILNIKALRSVSS
jgi:hypothetical protein